MYRFVLAGVEVTCDTAAELRAALADTAGTEPTVKKSVTTDDPFPRAKSPQRKSVPARRNGVDKSWQMARWLTTREGCTAEEARSKLARMKKADFAAYVNLEGEFFAAAKEAVTRKKSE